MEPRVRRQPRRAGTRRSTSAERTDRASLMLPAGAQRGQRVRCASTARTPRSASSRATWRPAGATCRSRSSGRSPASARAPRPPRQEGRYRLDAGQVAQAPLRGAQHRAAWSPSPSASRRRRRRLPDRRPLRRSLHAPIARHGRGHRTSGDRDLRIRGPGGGARRRRLSAVDNAARRPTSCLRWARWTVVWRISASGSPGGGAGAS